MAVAQFKLPMTFDVQRLQGDLAELTAEDWSPHFNQQQYEGDWSGVALRTTANARVPLYPDPSSTDERRRYYRLTPFGRRVAAEEVERLTALVNQARVTGLVSGA